MKLSLRRFRAARRLRRMRDRCRECGETHSGDLFDHGYLNCLHEQRRKQLALLQALEDAAPGPKRLLERAS